MKKVNHEMEDCANEYLNYYNNEEIDQLTSAERINSCTQLYANGETLVLQRQSDMGIKIKYDLKPYKDIDPHMTAEQKRHTINREGIVNSRKEGSVIVGESKRDLFVSKRVLLNDKIIYKSKDRCDCCVNLIKSDVDEHNKIACINCGYYGDIDSFKDGCDYCGAKYEIKDFAPKVSGCTIIENLEYRSAVVQKRLLYLYVGTFLTVFFLDMFLTFFIMQNPTGSVVSFYGTSFDFTFGLLSRMFFTVFILGVLDTLLINRNAYRFSNVKAVQDVLSDFSELEFIQDIEFRLKSIIMSKDYESLQGFIDCDISQFYESHKDVFDVCVCSVKFINAQKVNNGYGVNIGCQVRVKMLRLVDGKVKECYELIDLHIAKALEFKAKSFAAVRMYRCDKCGNAVDIYKGDICEYCNNQFDKHKLGWAVERLIYTKQINEYKMLPIVSIAAIVLAILSSFI